MKCVKNIFKAIQFVHVKNFMFNEAISLKNIYKQTSKDNFYLLINKLKQKTNEGEKENIEKIGILVKRILQKKIINKD